MKPVIKEFFKVEKPTIYNTFYPWIDDTELRNQLIENVLRAKERRKETQKEVGNTIRVSLTKVKEIENGTCKTLMLLITT